MATAKQANEYNTILLELPCLNLLGINRLTFYYLRDRIVSKSVVFILN